MASRPQVVVTDRRFSDVEPYTEAVEQAGGELVYGDFDSMDEVVEGVRDAAVIVTFKAPITREVFESASDLRLVVRNGAGFDNVDIKAANDHGVPVSVIKGYVDDYLSSHAIALMFAAAHDVATADREMRAVNGFGERAPINPMDGRTFGVVGLGQIGRATARKALGLGMDVIATDPYVAPDVFSEMGVERVEFDELIERVDCLSLNCQLTAETRHILSTPEFERMKETAVVVNTARGPLIDEQALVDAVESGEIWGAGLDVFETEPPTDTPALSCDRIACSPHHGGRGPAMKQRCIDIGRDEIVRALTGVHLQNVVNPEALKYGGELFSPELGSWE